MAKVTNRRIEATLRNPEFIDRLEDAKSMVQQGEEKGKAAYHILQHMNLKTDENNPDMFCHIPDRQLAEREELFDGLIQKTTVRNQRERLFQERWGIEKVVKDVDTSEVRIIGRGDESVYLYYFPTYKLNSMYYIKYIDDSYKTPIYKCNIGKIIGKAIKDVTNRVSQQMGQHVLPSEIRATL